MLHHLIPSPPPPPPTTILPLANGNDSFKLPLPFESLAAYFPKHYGLYMTGIACQRILFLRHSYRHSRKHCTSVIISKCHVWHFMLEESSEEPSRDRNSETIKINSHRAVKSCEPQILPSQAKQFSS